MTTSARASAIDDLRDTVAPVLAFFDGPIWARNGEPGVANFAVGNPHDMPLPRYVDALRAHLEPQAADWFAYKFSEPNAQEVIAASLTARARGSGPCVPGRCRGSVRTGWGTVVRDSTLAKAGRSLAAYPGESAFAMFCASTSWRRSSQASRCSASRNRLSLPGSMPPPPARPSHAACQRARDHRRTADPFDGGAQIVERAAVQAERHVLARVLVPDPVERAVQDLPPVGNDADMVAEPLGVLDQVGAEEDRPAGPLEIGDDVAQNTLVQGIEPLERLVDRVRSWKGAAT